MRISFSLLPEGERQSQASQQVEASPWTTSDTTRISIGLQPSGIPVPTLTWPTTRSVTRPANVRGSEMDAAPGNTRSIAPGSPNFQDRVCLP